MPRVLPSNAETWLAKRGVIDRPVILADIQTLDGTQFFWSDEDGYLPTIFPLGTRIQSSGGTSSQQYALGVTTTVAGDRCFVSVVVKNQGSKTVIIGSNGNGGDPSATIAPGSTQRVTINGTSVGNGLQITFNTQAVGDSWDVIAYNPLVTKNGSANLVPLANQNFTGWTVVGGATVTATPGFDVAPLQFYNGWIKGGFNFTVAKDFSTNAGDLLLQNISGNTIDRDVALALKSHELEGALCIVRLWLPLLESSINEFHCSLSEQNPKELEAGARCLQIFDPSQYALAGDIVSTLCTWRFKSLQCGSTGTASACAKRFTDCQDPARAATERFHAVLTTLPNTLTQPIAGQGGGGRLPPDDNGGGLGGRHHVPLQE